MAGELLGLAALINAIAGGKASYDTTKRKRMAENVELYTGVLKQGLSLMDVDPLLGLQYLEKVGILPFGSTGEVERQLDALYQQILQQQKQQQKQQQSATDISQPPPEQQQQPTQIDLKPTATGGERIENQQQVQMGTARPTIPSVQTKGEGYAPLKVDEILGGLMNQLYNAGATSAALTGTGTSSNLPEAMDVVFKQLLQGRAQEPTPQQAAMSLFKTLYPAMPLAGAPRDLKSTLLNVGWRRLLGQMAAARGKGSGGKGGAFTLKNFADVTKLAVETKNLPMAAISAYRLVLENPELAPLAKEYLKSVKDAITYDNYQDYVNNLYKNFDRSIKIAQEAINVGKFNEEQKLKWTQYLLAVKRYWLAVKQQKWKEAMDILQNKLATAKLFTGPAGSITKYVLETTGFLSPVYLNSLISMSRELVDKGLFEDANKIMEEMARVDSLLVLVNDKLGRPVSLLVPTPSTDRRSFFLKKIEEIKKSGKKITDRDLQLIRKQYLNYALQKAGIKLSTIAQRAPSLFNLIQDMLNRRIIPIPPAPGRSSTRGRAWQNFVEGGGGGAAP